MIAPLRSLKIVRPAKHICAWGSPIARKTADDAARGLPQAQRGGKSGHQKRKTVPNGNGFAT